MRFAYPLFDSINKLIQAAFLNIVNFFPSNAFLRRRRKKALLRVNDRGGGWKTCILASCRACLCACFVRACVLLYQINHARNSSYVQCLYSMYTVYTERYDYVVVQCILVISTHKSRRSTSRHISN